MTSYGADYGQTIYVHSPKDVPDGDQYAILEFSSISIPGDERSRTNPGHGYGARSEQTASCNIYKTKEAWEREIAYRTEQKFGHAWFPFILRRATVETVVKVTV